MLEKFLGKSIVIFSVVCLATLALALAVTAVGVLIKAVRWVLFV